MAILILWNLVFAAHEALVAEMNSRHYRNIPLIQSHGILHKQKCLLWQERWAQSGGQIELVQEHSGHSWGSSMAIALWRGAHLLAFTKAVLSSLVESARAAMG